jgi:hypothetical protein
MVKLASAGWGQLDGWSLRGVRHILRGLVDCIDFRSGSGLATISQVANKASYTTRWTSVVLKELEELGLIEWRRGGIVNGRPQPSFFRICKHTLVDLILDARRSYRLTVDAQKAQFLERLKAPKQIRLVRSRRSVHAEVGSTLSPLRGEVSASLPEINYSQFNFNVQLKVNESQLASDRERAASMGLTVRQLALLSASAV